MNYTAVITTINEPGRAVKEVAKRLPLIVIGDEKTPKEWFYEDALYYSGNGLNFSYLPPVNHYARKNLGYLLAMQQGADCIYDTDDDNIPNENWMLRTRECEAMQVLQHNDWVNVYKYFTPRTVWPRGLPLNKISGATSLSDPIKVSSPIHQGLADIKPDVDAIWRLIYNSNISFTYWRSINLPPHTWSPFNSQSTWWFKEAFPLMYLPQYCSMRMTDIIRSFVAQRCLWGMGSGVIFHSPSEVVQERNHHDLMKDFEDEIPGYLMNDKIKIALDGLGMTGDLIHDIVTCYFELVRITVLPLKETESLNQWLIDIIKILYRR